MTYFELTGQDECQTLVEVEVECEPASEEEDDEEEMKAKTTRFPLLFFKYLEAYLKSEEG